MWCADLDSAVVNIMRTGGGYRDKKIVMGNIYFFLALTYSQKEKNINGLGV